MNYYKVIIDDNAPAPVQLFIKSKYPIRHQITFEKYLECANKHAKVTEIEILSATQYYFSSLSAMPLNHLTDWDLFDKSKVSL